MMGSICQPGWLRHDRAPGIRADHFDANKVWIGVERRLWVSGKIKAEARIDVNDVARRVAMAGLPLAVACPAHERQC
jgi:hypothetical protein